MRQPLVTIVWFPGTNCHEETAHAFNRVGAKTRIVPISRFKDGRELLYQTDILAFPGGFSRGDYIQSGRVAAAELTYHHKLRDQLNIVLKVELPIIGICNGFQILVEAGLLPGNGEVGKPTAVLDVNTSGRFEHWQHTRVYFPWRGGSDHIWVADLGGQTLTMPSAHAEGRLVIAPQTKWADLASCIGAYYHQTGGTTTYPLSPNGGAIAALSNKSIFGLMPHPERDITGEGGGLQILEAGVKAVK